MTNYILISVGLVFLSYLAMHYRLESLKWQLKPILGAHKDGRLKIEPKMYYAEAIVKFENVNSNYGYEATARTNMEHIGYNVSVVQGWKNVVFVYASINGEKIRNQDDVAHDIKYYFQYLGCGYKV